MIFKGLKNFIKEVISPELYNILVSYQKYRKDKTKCKQTLKKINQVLLNKPSINIELGSNVKRPGFVTIDITNGADLYWNLKNPIPIPDNYVDVVYCSHLIEHFYHDDILRLLNEIYRILKRQGIYSICVPNARLYIEAYFNNIDLFQLIGENNPFFKYYSPLSYINFISYMGKAHKYMFDKDELKNILKTIGFSTVKDRDFDPQMDLEIRKNESLYVLAIK